MGALRGQVGCLSAAVCSPDARGAVIGPAPTLGRAIEAPGFNSRIVLALTGQLDSFPDFPISPVLAEEVAKVALNAARRGVPGEFYNSAGPRLPTVRLFNTCRRFAGLPEDVHALSLDELRSPAVAEKWGGAIVRTAEEFLSRGPDKRPSVHPLTAERLGYEPVDPEFACKTTVEWLIATGLLNDGAA